MNLLALILVLSNAALWFMLARALSAIDEWMDAVKDRFDGHQHEARYGIDMVRLSGPIVNASVDETESDG